MERRRAASCPAGWVAGLEGRGQRSDRSGGDGRLKDPAALNAYQQVKFVPFDPVSKRTEAEVKDAGGKTFYVTKGAPHIIIGLAKLAPEEEAKATAIAIVSALAAKGH